MKKLVVALCFLLSVNVNAQTTDWVKSCGGVQSDKGISIGTDSLGFIYISGFFNGQADFGPYTLYASYANNKNIFVAKMDSLGNFLWAVAGTGGPYDDRALGMHVTPGGDVFLTGTFWGYIEFPSASGPVSLGGNGCDTSVLVKIDSDGNCVFVIQVCNGTGSGSCPWPIYDCDDHSYDVKTDDDGFIYVTGFYSTYSADFGPFTLNNPNWVDCQPAGYIGKWDAAGNIIWVEGFDGIKDQRGSRDNRLAIDQFSNIYVSGGFQNTGIFGPFSLTSNGEWDAFIFKMDKDGNWLWAEGFGSNKTDRANSIAVDVCNDVYITGEYRNPMVFPGANASNGTDTLSHKQKRDVFVAKMNNQGQWKWAKRARSSKTDKPYQMSVDINKQVFICGTSGSEMTYSSGLVVNAQIPGDTTMSAWVAQIDGASNNGDWVWAKMGGCDTDDDDRTNDICPDGFGNVYAIGFFEDLADFDGTILDATGRKKDIFIWKMSMTPGSFTINNAYDTIIHQDSMVFNPLDTGLALSSSSFTLDGCDTLFVDSMIHLKLAARIYYKINVLGSTTGMLVDGSLINLPLDSSDYFLNDIVNLSSVIDPLYEFIDWHSDNHTFLPNSTSLSSSFIVNSSDTIVLNISKKPEITYIIDPPFPLTSSTITVDGVVIGAFPTTISYPTNQLINISANPDPNYGFEYWHADSVILMPSADSSTASFLASNNATVTLHVYKKPTITYIVDPPGTTTSIDINGLNISAPSFPYSATVFIDDLNTINPIIDPLFSFSSWETDSNNLLNGSSMNNSFYGAYNDTITLIISEVSAFINSVNNSICDNDTVSAEVLVSFLSGTPPYTFVYQINGINQPQITTEKNPHIIRTRKEGVYTLSSFSDVNISGDFNGSAVITVLESPIADFNAYPDTLSILYTTASFTDKSTTETISDSLISWDWDFGDDNLGFSTDKNPTYSYSHQELSQIELYEVSLIVTSSNSCSDITSKIITVTDDYWVWIPNSFTPDLDGINDKFCIAYHGIRENTFTFNVFDRFSNLVYSTNNIHDLDCENGWDGKHQSTGNELPMGVYIYKMYYQDFDGWKHQEIKELILVR
jgi:gliding motility-associated-like protein